MRKLRVFKSPQDLITARSSLLAVSNQYGIVYVAGENKCKWMLHEYEKLITVKQDVVFLVTCTLQNRDTMLQY